MSESASSVRIRSVRRRVAFAMRSAQFGRNLVVQGERVYGAKRQRRPFKVLVPASLLLVLPFAASLGNVPTVSAAHACPSASEVGNLLVAGDDSEYRLLSNVLLGGVRQVSLVSTCDQSRYKITLAGKPARVIEVKTY
ncbi:MAG: hypothetical protein RLZ71_384 [Actinomycetota bacterium]